MRNLLLRLDRNLFFILIAAIAIIMRVYGNGYGLPDQLNIDEIHVVSRAIKFGSGDLNPHFFFYPALHMYLMFAVYIFYFLAGSVTGIFQSAADFGMQYFIDPTAFYLIARTVSALMGAATVLLAGAFAQRYYGRAAGAAASILLALNYLHAEQSHYTTTDVPMTFWFMLSLYFAPGPGMKAPRRNFVLAGIFGGMAVATKYTAVLLLPVLLIMFFLHAAREKKSGGPGFRRLPDFCILAAVFIAAFFVCAPYTLLDYQTFRADMAIQKRLLDFGWLGFENIGNMWWHIISVYMVEGLGLPLLVISIASITWSLVRRRGPDAALAFFLVVFYVINAKSGQVFTRYFVPATPALCILSGRLLADAVALFRNRAIAAACFAALLVSFIPAKNLIAFEATLREKDTRTLAREWIEDNIPPGARIATDMTGPQLHPTQESISDNARFARYENYRVPEADPFFAWKDRKPAPEQQNSSKSFHLRALERIPKKYFIFQPYALAQYSLDLYRDEGFDYIVASGETYGRYFDARKEYPEAAAFYDSLDRSAELLMEFPRNLKLRHGHELKVYKLKKEN